MLSKLLNPKPCKCVELHREGAPRRGREAAPAQDADTAMARGPWGKQCVDIEAQMVRSGFREKGETVLPYCQ